MLDHVLQKRDVCFHASNAKFCESAVESLAGKVAVVTGASRGIGKGIATELGAAGATVYVTGRTVEEGSAPLPGTIGATASFVTAQGGKGIAVRCDHSVDDDCFERSTLTP